MMRTLTRMVVVMACTLGLAGLAAADEPAPDKVKPVPGEPPAAKAPPADKPVKRPPPAPDAPAADGASAEVKAGTGVVKKEVVGEATSFAKGTKVWAWSKVLGAKGTTVKHVWKRDGAVLWEKELAIGSNRQQGRQLHRRRRRRGRRGARLGQLHGGVVAPRAARRFADHASRSRRNGCSTR